MNNLITRDPTHHKASSRYITNMDQLVVTLDGKQINSRLILNVDTKPMHRAPYVELMQLDTDAKIVTDIDVDNAERITTTEISGAIEISGTPSYCSCYSKRRIKRWWSKLDQGYVGW